MARPCDVPVKVHQHTEGQLLRLELPPHLYGRVSLEVVLLNVRNVLKLPQEVEARLLIGGILEQAYRYYLEVFKIERVRRVGGLSVLFCLLSVIFHFFDDFLQVIESVPEEAELLLVAVRPESPEIKKRDLVLH